MTTRAEFNAQVIDEFRANEGRVGGTLEGAPSDPGWVRNLEAQPRTTIEVGRDTISVFAEVAAGEERERLFAIGAERFPQLAEYARKADRVIPVIVLTPLDM